MRVNVLKDIRVAVRLPAVIGFGIVTLLVTGLVAISTLSELKVGGPHYDRVMLRTQLLREIAQPVAALDPVTDVTRKAQLEVLNGTFELTPERVAEFEAAVSQYMERSAYWLDTLEPGSPEHTGMAVARDAATEYVRIMREELLAKVVAGGDVQLLLAEWTDDLEAVVAQYDAAIASAVAATEAEVAEVSEAAHDLADSRQTVLVIVLVLAIVMAGGAASLVTMSVVRPLRSLRIGLLSIARGETETANRLDADRRDDFGEVALAFNEIAQRLADEAAAAETAAASAERRARHVEDAASLAARNIAQAAHASRQLSSTASEIARSAGDASTTASNAVQAAAHANELMERLSESSQRIGEVVGAIRGIAGQTTMLALNATIEAARAGESGRGFAVVANEVKDLAAETDAATDDIVRRVEQIHADTRAALAALADVNRVIADISYSQSVIADAVEEQAATTAEMDHGLSEAVAAVDELAGPPPGVGGSAVRGADRNVDDRIHHTADHDAVRNIDHGIGSDIDQVGTGENDHSVTGFVAPGLDRQVDCDPAAV